MRMNAIHLPRRYRHRLLLLCVVCFFSGLLVLPIKADDFTDQFIFMDEQKVSEVGREAKNDASEQLLREYPDHADRAKAMLAIATAYEISIPSLTLKPDYSQAILWVRKATDEAAEGSEDWLKAMFLLASRLRKENPKESQELLKKIKELSPGPVIDVKVLYELQMLALQQDDLKEAERICVLLQEWPYDQSRMPDAMFDKGKVFSSMQSSATSMMNAWVYSDATKVEREKKLTGFAERYPTQYNQDQLKELKNLLVSLSPDPGFKPSRLEGDNVNRTWIWINILVIAGILLALFLRSKRRYS